MVWGKQDKSRITSFFFLSRTRWMKNWSRCWLPTFTSHKMRQSDDSWIPVFVRHWKGKTATYNINVYATKVGCENSETATATLCWIDVEPKTEGIENNVAQVRVNAVLIQSESGKITVNGAGDGTNVSVYGTNGVLSGTAISNNGNAVVNTHLQMGSVAIVKIGEKTVKVIIR